MSNIIGISIIKKLTKYWFVGLTVILCFSLVKNILQIRTANQKIEVAKEKIDNLRDENQTLKIGVNEAAQEVFIEKQARDKLGLAKEGEIVLVLPDEEVLRTLGKTTETSEKNLLPDPNWKKWLKLFL